MFTWGKWETKYQSFVWLPFAQMNHWPPLCCLSQICCYLAVGKSRTPVRDQWKTHLIARQSTMAKFIWSICGCYWGVSCCTPCGPLVGLQLQLPSLGSHPEEGRKILIEGSEIWFRDICTCDQYHSRNNKCCERMYFLEPETILTTQSQICEKSVVWWRKLVLLDYSTVCYWLVFGASWHDFL